MSCLLERAYSGCSEEFLIDCLFLYRAGSRLKARALDNSLLERHFSFQSTVCCDLMHGTSATGRFSNNCYLAWVASKLVDVFPNPFQSESLIKKASVSDSFALERRA